MANSLKIKAELLEAELKYSQVSLTSLSQDALDFYSALESLKDSIELVLEHRRKGIAKEILNRPKEEEKVNVKENLKHFWELIRSLQTLPQFRNEANYSKYLFINSKTFQAKIGTSNGLDNFGNKISGTKTIQLRELMQCTPKQITAKLALDFNIYLVGE